MWSEDGARDVVDKAEMNTEMDAENTSNNSQDEEGNNGRERSLSVPCRSESTNVETVVTKAKRASSYLWLLLHSQVGQDLHPRLK